MPLKCYHCYVFECSCTHDCRLNTTPHSGPIPGKLEGLVFLWFFIRASPKVWPVVTNHAQKRARRGIKVRNDTRTLRGSARGLYRQWLRETRTRGRTKSSVMNDRNDRLRQSAPLHLVRQAVVVICRCTSGSRIHYQSIHASQARNLLRLFATIRSREYLIITVLYINRRRGAI